MAVYRAEHIQEDTIAMVPVHGYTGNTNFSVDAIRWLDYTATKENVFIQHALNENGEKKVLGVSVDGFSENSNTIYQYHVSFVSHKIIFIIFYF